MNQNKIEQFKAILKKWNPLGIAENNIADLNDYETEVDDIIFHLEIEYDFPEKSITQKQLSKIIKEVLNQAFDLHLTNSECDAHSEEILKILKD
jgi:superfamily I DNA and/or RNA helicase